MILKNLEKLYEEFDYTVIMVYFVFIKKIE